MCCPHTLAVFLLLSSRCPFPLFVCIDPSCPSLEEVQSILSAHDRATEQGQHLPGIQKKRFRVSFRFFLDPCTSTVQSVLFKNKVLFWSSPPSNPTVTPWAGASRRELSCKNSKAPTTPRSFCPFVTSRRRVDKLYIHTHTSSARLYTVSGSTISFPSHISHDRMRWKMQFHRLFTCMLPHVFEA